MVPKDGQDTHASGPSADRQRAAGTRMDERSHPRQWRGAPLDRAIRLASAHPFALGCVLLVALWSAASWPWISGRAIIPWDSIDVFFPQSAFVVSSISRGDAPWWNPYAFAGIPVLGDPQGMIFTPHTLTGLLSGASFGLHVFDLTTLACVLVGGLALYRYTLPQAGNRVLPLLGALVFMLGGVATSRLQHVPQVISYGLLPVLLLALRAVCERPTPLRSVLLACAGLGLVLNPNHVVFLAPFMLAPLALLHLVQAPRPGRSLAAVAVAGAGVVLIAAPVLAAVVETVGISTRTRFDLSATAISSFPAFNLLSMVLPGLFGALTPASGFWPTTDITQDYLYLGVIPTCVVFLSLLRPDRPPAILRICQAMLVVAFLFAMGTRTPFFPLLFENLPGFASFRRPADGAYFLNLFAALTVGLALAPGTRAPQSAWARFLPAAALVVLLAALIPGLYEHAARTGQLAAFWHSLGSFGRRFAVGAGACLAIVLVARRFRGPALASFILLFTTADLALAGRLGVFAPRDPQVEIARLYRRPAGWQAINSPLADTLRHLATSQQPHDASAWRMEALGGPFGTLAPQVFGIPNAQGYNPLKLATYAATFGAQDLQQEAKEFTAAAPGYGSDSYRWLGLRHVLLHSYIAAHPDQFGPVGAQVARIRAELDAAPWAIRRDAPGLYEIWELPGAYSKAGLTGLDRSGRRLSDCDVQAYRNTSLTVRCRADRPALLVVNDALAPGWSACVNGRDTPIRPFLHALRAVEVPAGDSVVSMRYQPVPWFRRLRSCGSG